MIRGPLSPWPGSSRAAPARALTSWEERRPDSDLRLRGPLTRLGLRGEIARRNDDELLRVEMLSHRGDHPFGSQAFDPLFQVCLIGHRAAGVAKVGKQA